MGLLDSIFGGGAQQSGGRKPSPMVLGLLALLAYRAYQNRNESGGIFSPSGRGASPGQPMPGGTMPGHGGMMPGQPGASGGGLGDILGGIFGGGGRSMGAGPAGSGGLGDLLRGGLGGLLGGAAAGTMLNGGLGDLLRRFQTNGYGDAADSWVGHGPNRQISPSELENAVGRDTLQELSNQSGRPYQDVLSELSESLPDAVDKMTPDGRVPNEEESSRWL